MKELTKKDKELVLIDISARLPYGIFVKDNHESLDGKPIIYTLDYHPWIDTCKPFLRPLSSMTEDERNELSDLINKPSVSHISVYSLPCDTNSILVGLWRLILPFLIKTYLPSI